MKKFIVLISVFLGLEAYSQNGKFIPFKLVVLTPNEASIGETYKSEADSIVKKHQGYYYAALDQVKMKLACKECPRDSAEVAGLREELYDYERIQPLVQNFQAYFLLSNYSAATYNYFFNEYPPYSTIIELQSLKQDFSNIQSLADSINADYVISFREIYTISKDGWNALYFSARLYSKKENSIIDEAKFEADVSNYGSMWTCDMNLKLSCMLINGVRLSSEQFSKAIALRQNRSK